MTQSKEGYGKVVRFLESKNVQFLAACETAGVPPTRRQASKWLSHKGLAYKTYKGIA